MITPFATVGFVASAGSSAFEPVGDGSVWLLACTVGLVAVGVPLNRWADSMRRQRDKNNAEAENLADELGIDLETPVRESLMRQRLIRIVLYLFSACVGLAATMGVNAYFDASDPVWRPIKVRKLLVESHYVIFKQHIVEFEFADTGDFHRVRTTPAAVEKLRGHEGLAFAAVRGGALGIEWVSAIEPKAPRRKQQN